MEIITVSNGYEFYFSKKHYANVDDFVPVSIYLPMTVVPRKGLEDGVMRDLKDFLLVLHTNERLIPNPDPDMEKDAFYREGVLIKYKYVCLKSIHGDRFYTTNHKYPEKLANGDVVYTILGYATSSEEAQRILYPSEKERVDAIRSTLIKMPGFSEKEAEDMIQQYNL